MDIVSLHGGAGHDRDIAFDLLKEVDETTGLPRLVRKASFDHDVLAMLAQGQRRRAATKVRDRRAVQLVRGRARKENLMVILLHPDLVDEDKLRDDGAPSQLAASA